MPSATRSTVRAFAVIATTLSPPRHSASAVLDLQALFIAIPLVDEDVRLRDKLLAREVESRGNHEVFMI